MSEFGRDDRDPQSVCFCESSIGFATPELVKGYGRRPAQVVRPG